MLNAFAKVSGLEKTARIWSRPVTAMSGRVRDGGCDEPWSTKFKGSPFLKKAQDLERSQTGDRVADAEREIQWSERSLEDAKFRVKIAQVEKKLADWSFTQEGSEKLAFQEKLAECRYRSFKEWSDHFKGSPLYKTAMALEVEDAKREAVRRRADLEERSQWRKNDENSADRADLEAELACWRLEQMGFSKTASVALATMPSEDRTMPFSQNTVEAFFGEVDAIEKSAAPVPRGLAAGLAVAGTAAGTTAGGVFGHKKGRKKGRREGLHVGYRYGARKGYRAGAKRGYMAGRHHTIAQLRARMAAAKQNKSKSKGREKLANAPGSFYFRSALKRTGKASPGGAVTSAFARRGKSAPKISGDNAPGRVGAVFSRHDPFVAGQLTAGTTRGRPVTAKSSTENWRRKWLRRNSERNPTSLP